MKTVRYYGKTNRRAAIIIAVLFILLLVGFIFLPDSVKSSLFSIRNRSFNLSDIPIKTMRGVAYIVTVATLTPAMVIAFGKKKSGNKKEVIMTLSKTKINLLPVDIHPVDVFWEQIKEISVEKTWSGRQILVLSTPEFKLDGYWKKIPIIKSDLSSLNAKPEDVFEQVKKFHRYYTG